MKICFTSDFHGRQTLYEQLDALLHAERPDLLILGGDMFADGEVDDPVATQVAYVDRCFVPRIRAWRDQWPELSIACILGNHDWLCTRQTLLRHEESALLSVLCHDRCWQHDGVAFLGFSYTPPTPYWLKDFERLDREGDPLPETGGTFWDVSAECTAKAAAGPIFSNRPTLAQELEGSARCGQPWIFVCHPPPYDTHLDRLPHVVYPVGSKAVRLFIEERQPLCALHGHIHESPDVTGNYRDQIGETLSVNPGQSDTRLRAVVFDANDPTGTMRHSVYS